MNLCLSNNLKTLRQKNGFSLEALAEIISVSRQTVAKWEAGDSYPELINCLYIDAPVLNYMSCPCGFGVGNPLSPTMDEILNALKITMPELLAYRDMPLDKLPLLIENRIPVIMVAGDSDTTVPYIENGAFLEREYSKTNIDFEVYIKECCDHHPHGLEDPTPVIDFILRHI